MAYQQNNIGENCPFCEEGVLIQYRSGKIGCNKLCWKKDAVFSQKRPERGFQRAAEPKKEIPVIENLATKEDVETILRALREIYKSLDYLKKASVIYPDKSFNNLNNAPSSENLQ